jgi:predicted membrane protein
LLFLFYAIKTKFSFIYKNKFYLLFLYFYIICILSSLLSENVIFSLKSSIFYIRVFFFIGLIFGIIILFKFYFDKKRDNRRKTIWSSSEQDYILNPDYRGDTPNLLIEFIKAKYNKYCPKIDWLDPKNN